MFNEIKCAIQYTVDLINNNINGCARRMCKQQKECENIGCTGYVHIKLSHVNVMRPILSLGA